MGVGTMQPVTEMYGRRRACPETGRRIATEIGPTFRLGVGPGLSRSRGVLRPFTMADGPSWRAVGAGCQDRWQYDQFTRQRSWPLSEGAGLASELESGAVAGWDGSRWGREKYLCPGIEPVRATWRT